MTSSHGDSRPHLKVAALGATLLLLMVVVVGLGVLSLTSIQRDYETFAEEDFPAFNHLIHVDRDLFRARAALEEALLTADLEHSDAALVEYELQLDRTEARWIEYLEVAKNSPGEVELQNDYEQHRASWIAANLTLKELSLSNAPVEQAIVSDLVMESSLHFDAARTAVHDLEEEFYEPLVENGTDASRFDARLLLLVLLGIGATVGLGISIASVRSTKRQYLELRQRELNKRFRSLVESAQDVITVVSGGDDLSVMSTDLGPLAVSPDAPPVTSVADILDPATYEIWEAADRIVRLSNRTEKIEFESKWTGGPAVYVEAQGSTMADDPTERVWVWRDITERKELELQLSHQAFHDSLTGVANRSLLHDRIDHALSMSNRSGRPVTLLFADLDDFKTVNDSLGHQAGDELLKVITKRISSSVRSSDTVARLGGDEFAILLEDTDTETAAELCERVLKSIARIVELGERFVSPSASIGIATALPGTTTEELIRNADLAMYAAKNAGRGQSKAYQERMHEVTSEALVLQADLRNAIANDELALHFQPTVSLSNGDIEGFEALLRWAHPERGTIPPDRFIPIAEATGLIIPIGRWVLQEACTAAVQLRHEKGASLTMSVNISPQQLRDPNIVRTVETALARTGLPAPSLVLEITEGSLLDDDSSIERLNDLKNLGLQIAIDDFGTGYASVSYLQNLPIDIVKIDRSFISGDALTEGERKAFLNAIIGLAKSLNLRSVAEGVEDEDQRDELTELGCDTGQGFLWSPATPLSQTQFVIEQISGEHATTVNTSSGAPD
ncbi:MAG: EAL domain-containing protein [Actinomycetia bacterium]|nr:EAL domain-containing protein [Actinomycetes bacterium]